MNATQMSARSWRPLCTYLASFHLLVVALVILGLQAGCATEPRPSATSQVPIYDRAMNRIEPLGLADSTSSVVMPFVSPSPDSTAVPMATMKIWSGSPVMESPKYRMTIIEPHPAFLPTTHTFPESVLTKPPKP